MEFLNQFIEVVWHYAEDLWFSVFLGFLLSGIFYQLVPGSLIEKYLGQPGWKPLFISSFIGTLLPVCCFGSLPIAVTLQKKGARLGPVLAFLVTTPATSVSALVICWKLLGVLFTVYIFFAVIVIGLIIGWIGNRLKAEGEAANPPLRNQGCELSLNPETGHSFPEKIKGIFTYAFITLPKNIGLELILGILIASFIMVFQPLQDFIQTHLKGMWGYLVIVIVSLATYVCSTANVPLAHALLKSGLSEGQVMTYLIIGPVTSYSTFMVLRKAFGFRVMWVYTAALCVLTILSGLLFDILLWN